MSFIWLENGIKVHETPPVHRKPRIPGTLEEFPNPFSGEFKNRQATDRYREAETKTQIREKVYYARQVMSSPVITMSPETNLEDAWEIIREKRFRHIPVVWKDGKILGIFSDRDILREAACMWSMQNGEKQEMKVKDIFKTRVLTAKPDMNIREIARVLIEEKIGCMPIVDDDGFIIGIITRSDILRTLVNHAPLELWT